MELVALYTHSRSKQFDVHDGAAAVSSIDRFFSFVRHTSAALRQLAHGQVSYPVFRYELSYWDKRLGGRWRLEEAFVLLTLGNLCLLPIALLIFPALLALYAVLDEVLGLLLAVPAAALIVREREEGTLSILRATPLSGLQIAVGKLAGLLYLVWEGASYLVIARWVGTLLALPLLALMLVSKNPFPLAQTQPVGLVGVGLVVVYLTFIYRPQFNVLYTGALGLAASTLARSTREAIGLVMLPAGALSAAALGVLIWFYRVGELNSLFSESVLADHLHRIFIWLVPLALVTLVRLLLTVVCFGLAAHRIDRLTESGS